MGRINYYKRIFSAYLTLQKSHLTFWHGEPLVNENFSPGELGEYYMPFLAKADYSGHYDSRGIPMLDYHGAIGLQYNPIAIAQYGLGNYNYFRRTGSQERKDKFLNVADWLVENLEETVYGTKIWYHHFDWEYRDTLKAPWYSALAQGQGISMLVRAYDETGEDKYLKAAEEAFGTFTLDMKKGGVVYTDDDGDVWFEEYLVDPPTHILNGFIWASWGIYDYWLATKDPIASELFSSAVKTLASNLKNYDIGFWSLYEQSGTRIKMIASSFYHSLHIIQLRVFYKITGKQIFRRYANRWLRFKNNPIKRRIANIYKIIFKLLYY